MMRASLRTHAQHIAQSTHAALFMHCMVGQVAEPGLRRAGAAEASAERRLLPSRSVSVYDCSLSFSLLGPAARSAKRGARGPWRVSREGHRFAYSDESVVPASAAAISSSVLPKIFFATIGVSATVGGKRIGEAALWIA